jgi:succinyl-diaminopimelate desuccinylase
VRSEKEASKLQDAVHARRDEMAQLIAELVTIPTENPPGVEYERAIRLFAAACERLGFEAVVQRVPGDDDGRAPQWWLRALWGRGRRTVHFHGHIDVVPANAPGLFDPRITQDTIFGRGSSDMKGGLVAMLYAMHAIADSGAEPDGRIALTVVPDEETGGARGSRALLDAGLLVDDDAIAMFTAEPTSGVIWNGCRGAITCRVRVPGRPSHVGLQHLGVNAFERSFRILDQLRDLKQEVEQRRTVFALEPEAARGSILMLGGEVSGGANFNLVPESFCFSVDRRLNPEEDFDTEKHRLLDAITAAGVGAEIEIIQEARPAGVSESTPAARALATAITDTRGEPPRFELCPGMLEIRFHAEKGVPAFAYGPGLLSVSHGPREFVKRRDIEDCAVVYARAAMTLLS